jgi:hypothetical protein
MEIGISAPSEHARLEFEPAHDSVHGLKNSVASAMNSSARSKE